MKHLLWALNRVPYYFILINMMIGLLSVLFAYTAGGYFDEEMEVVLIGVLVVFLPQMIGLIVMQIGLKRPSFITIAIEFLGCVIVAGCISFGASISLTEEPEFDVMTLLDGSHSKLVNMAIAIWTTLSLILVFLFGLKYRIQVYLVRKLS